MIETFDHSQKTGYTTKIQDETHMSHLFNDSHLNLLIKQNELQKLKIKQLEEERAQVDANGLIVAIAK
jgi:hypothetical protein